MRYFVEFSYHGKAYHGWQRQPNAISVQQVMEEAFSLLLRTPVALTAAGRTDAGVHARFMAAHFEVEQAVKAEDLCHRLNAYLPGDIALKRIYPVNAEAHARFDAVSRSYEYHITRIKDPFTSGLAHEYKAPLDVEAMNKAAAQMLEHSDFECFSRSRTDVKTFLCHITHARWETEDDHMVFHISADRFLRNMVRAIVGTLLEVGRGQMDQEGFAKVLQSRNRSKAGASVPACGLYLTRVEYPETIALSNE